MKCPAPLAAAALAGLAVTLALSCGGAGGSGDTPASGGSLVGVNCPEVAPMDRAACRSEGSVCGWTYRDATLQQDLYSECACREAGARALKWDCSAGFYTSLSCPEAQPSPGTACPELVGTTCYYAERLQCVCNDPNALWTCESPIRPDYLEPPASPSPGKAVSALSAEERQAWCTWFSRPFFVSDIPAADGEVNERGYTIGTGCITYDALSCHAGLVYLSIAQCEANLALSSCNAPVAELTECVVTFRSGCWPLVHGCARYLEKPGCTGTIFAAHDLTDESIAQAGADSCTVRVR